MTLLAQLIEHRSDEPAYAYFERLSALAGLDRRPAADAYEPKLYAELFALNFTNLRNGSANEALSLLTNTPTAALDAATPRIIKSEPRNNALRVLFRNELFLPSSFRPDERRFCPACLAEDALQADWDQDRSDRHNFVLASGYRRTWWDFTFMQTCPKHQTLLINSCTTCNSPFFSSPLPRRGSGGCDHAGDLAMIAWSSPMTRTKSRLDKYLFDRVYGIDQPPVAIVDDLRIDLIDEVTQRFGDVLADDWSRAGRNPWPNTQTRDKGFDFFMNYPKDFAALLARLHRIEAGPLSHHEFCAWLFRTRNKKLVNLSMELIMAKRGTENSDDRQIPIMTSQKWQELFPNQSPFPLDRKWSCSVTDLSRRNNTTLEIVRSALHELNISVAGDDDARIISAEMGQAVSNLIRPRLV